MENWYQYLILFLTGLLVTVATTPLAKRVAIKFDAIDYPSSRRINTKPIPRMGGLAIFLGVLAAFIVQYIGAVHWGWPSAFIPHPYMQIDYALLAGSAFVIFLTGLVDDVVSLKPILKLLGQVIAGCMAAASGLLIGIIVNPFDGGAEIDLGLLAYPITVFYLVAFANIINLIDGLDGLAAGISAIVSLSLFGIATLSGRVDAAALGVALAGCCLGFLRYNFHPASIFMGDSGSLFIGFVLGVTSLLNVTRFAALTSLIIPLIIAGVPIIDTFAAIVRRRRGHVSIAQADKGHIQHRLMRQGFDQRQTALLIYSWSILLSLGAFVMIQVQVVPRILLFLLLLVVSFVFVRQLHLFEPVLRHYYNPKTHTDVIVDVSNDEKSDETK